MQRLVLGIVLLVFASPLSAKDEPPAALVAGERIETAAVEALIRGAIMDLRAREQQLRSQALDSLIGDAVLRREAAARGLSEQALERAEIEDKAALSDAEVRAYYQDNKARFGATPEADALRQIEQGLGQQRRGERRAAFVRELRAKYGVRVLLEPYRVLVEIADSAVRGNAQAPITVVEFSDFQCPYCVRARPTVKRIRETYGDKVRWVFRHFPLDFHEMAEKAGEAAACAGEQGKFWQMHDRLWQNEGRLRPAELKAAAAALSLDTAAFGECLDSGRRAGLVQRDLEAGMALGVSGTPAFFVNGRPLFGAQPFEAFQQVIDDELQRSSPQAVSPAASK